MLNGYRDEDLESCDSASTNSSVWTEAGKEGHMSLHGTNRDGVQKYKMRFVTTNPTEFRQVVAAARDIQDNSQSEIENFQRFVPSLTPMQNISNEQIHVTPPWDQPLMKRIGAPPNMFPPPNWLTSNSGTTLVEYDRGNIDFNIQDQLGDEGRKDEIIVNPFYR